MAKIKTIKKVEQAPKGWLEDRFGEHSAQISTIITLKVKSAIKDVARILLKKVPPEIESLTKRIKVAPKGVGDYDFVFGYEDDSGVNHQGSIETDTALQDYI